MYPGLAIVVAALVPIARIHLGVELTETEASSIGTAILILAGGGIATKFAKVFGPSITRKNQ